MTRPLSTLTASAALCLALAATATAITATGTTTVNATVNESLGVTATASVTIPALNVGATSAAIAAPVTVVSNVTGGYQLSVARTAFTNGDIPLSFLVATPADVTQLLDVTAATATAVPTSGGQNVGHRTATITAAIGDTWTTSLQLGPVPFTRSGAHASTVTFTAVGL